MVKHSYIGLFKIISLIFSTFLIIAFSIGFIFSIINEAPQEFKKGIFMIVFLTSIYQFIVVELICYLFAKFGKSVIIISENLIQIKKINIITSETRIIYSKINYSNYVGFCAGELVAMVNGDGIRLGWFTKREINKIKKFIPTIMIQ